MDLSPPVPPAASPSRTATTKTILRSVSEKPSSARWRPVHPGQLLCGPNLRRVRMKATELLTKQHREVKALFGKAKKAKSADRRNVMDEITRKLQTHMT